MSEQLLSKSSGLGSSLSVSSSRDMSSMNESSVYIVSPELSGYLIKKGFYWRKLWKRKWVVLHGDEISYMEEKPTKETARSIHITKAHISIKSVIDTEDIEDDPNGFAIHINDEEEMGSDASPPWYLRAESLEDKKLWLNKLCRTHAITHWLHQYEKIKVLGVGGSAVVHELKHKRTGKRYAMKEMEIKNRGMMEMAAAEAEMLLNIMERVNHHPNIMEISKVFHVGDKFYLVFPLCTGGELYNAIVKRGHFTEYDAAVIFRDLISALQVLHSNDILHLDIKPENILFESDDADAKIKLTDFGLSRVFHTDKETGVCTEEAPPTEKMLQDKLDQFVTSGILQSHMRGTMGYMAPELILCNYSSKPADLWAAGVVLYILLSGKPPFHSRSNRDVMEKSAKCEYSLEGDEWEDVSADAKDLISKLLKFDPNTRLTADQVLEHPWVKMVTATTADEGAEEGPARARRLTSSTPLSGAIRNLTGHVKDRRVEKMATNLSKLMTSLRIGDKNKQQTSTQTLLQRLTAGLDTKNGNEDDDKSSTNDSSVEESLHSFMSSDMKDSIISMFQELGAGDDNRISCEEFCQIFQGIQKKEDKHGSNALITFLMSKFIDTDRDGYITLEDIFLAEAKVLQRSSDFVKTIFRVFSEALWYPGQKMNHLQIARGLGVFNNGGGGEKESAERQSAGGEILSAGSNSTVADVFEPPKFITAKHVAAVFEKLGYNPDVGIEIFESLCKQLAEHRIAQAKARESSGGHGSVIDETSCMDKEEQDERDVADILKERKSMEEDVVPPLISHFPLANALARTVTNTYNAATQDKNVDEVQMNKMDVKDFVDACEIDDILIQAIQLKPRKRMFDLVAKKQEETRRKSEGRQSLSKFVYFEGWLEKQGSKVKNWKKRWFVLHQPPGPGQNFTLKYYTNDKKSAEKGFFKILKDSTVSDLSDSHRGENKKHQNYFELNAMGNNGKTQLLLSAETPEMKQEWIDNIQRCIDLSY